ncbi:methyltransferase domain-containing protein [Nocardia colli]|uniref:Methyltransferase domain-containing protein n=1 Tax=Nocardia colli TaxID=2545717 RepID=A0A5N0DXJ7_9NOCA|nr:methyltransferase [Nocardia colli]KAA8881857.1 methyltransferase domain-containing protein [Nocardia colli]
MNESISTDDRIPVRRNTDGRTFLIEAFTNFRTTGAIAPSSRRLAARLAAPLHDQAGQPLAVLEVGAGTGSVTRALIPLLCAGSRLDIVEVNPRFAAHLRRLVHTHPHPAAATNRVCVHQTLVEQFETGHRYDSIVSGLPFTNFTADQVRKIMDRYLELLHPGGTLTYFSYLATGHARRLLASRAEAVRHRAVEAVLADYRRRYATGSSTVWGNVPPARVWQLQAPLPSDVPNSVRIEPGAHR